MTVLFLAATTVAGGSLGAHQMDAAFWKGGLCAAAGLLGVTAFYILTAFFDIGLATNPILWAIVFLLAVEYTAPLFRMEMRQCAATAGGGLVLDIMLTLFWL
jgi:hypothetical protein